MSVDERVYKLYIYLQENTFNRDDISEFLEITTRQLSRLLNKWQEEGIIEYKSGMGRGNASEVSFKVNVESHFVNHLIHNIKSYDIQQLQDILQIPMSDSSRKLIKICIDESIFVKEKVEFNDYYHMEYLYHLPHTLNPLSPMDISLLKLLNNIADTLYFYENNELKSNIVIYDEWEDNDLIIHLYRNIRYSNGDMLHASDVVHCIEYLIESKKETEVYGDVIGIEVINANKIRIKMKKRKEAIKWVFSKVESSIYKKVNEDFIFTGAYKVDSIEEGILKTSFNPYYHHGIPDITSVIYVNDVAKYQEYYGRYSFKERYSDDTHNNDFILFNPKTELSLEERGEVIYATQCFLDGKKYHTRLTIQKSFKILLLKQSKKNNQALVSKLNEWFDTLEVVETSISTYLENHLDSFNVDLVVMNEVVPNNQFYYELLTSGKFIDWYYNAHLSKELLHIYNAKGAEYRPYIEARYNNHMKENQLIVLLDKYRKTFYFPDNFENVTTDPYGIVFYNTIVVVDEGKDNDR